MDVVIKKDKQKYLIAKCQLGKQISTTHNYWQKIITVKHPTIKGREKDVLEVLKCPDIIRISKSDKKVFLYYKKYHNNYLCTVVKHHNHQGFIITVYITNKIKEGKLIWQKTSKPKN